MRDEDAREMRTSGKIKSHVCIVFGRFLYNLVLQPYTGAATARHLPAAFTLSDTSLISVCQKWLYATEKQQQQQQQCE